MSNYVVLAVVCLGTVVSSYVSSCVNIALPDIMAELNFNMDSIVWVSLSYLLPYGSMLPLTGKLGDKYGAKQMYIVGLCCFSLGSALCGVAAGPASMIVFRVIQGIGGAILLPNAMSIVAVNFTGAARATALGLWSATTAVGAAFGPTVGGYLIELLKWRSIFFSVIPLCLIGILMAALIIPKTERAPEAKIDFIGGGLLVVGIGALLVALNQGEREGWLSSYYIVSLFYLSVSAMIVFVLVELRVSGPIIDFRLFNNCNFLLANLISGLTFFILQSSTYLLPFFLKTILHYDSVRAGMMMLPLTLTMVVFASLSGRLNAILGPRPLTFVGVGATTYAFMLLSRVNADFGPHDFFVPLAIFGFGLGLTMSPMTTCAISTLKKTQVGVGSGILNFSKLISGSIGVVVVQVVMSRREVYHGEIIKTTLQAGHDPFTIYQLIAALQEKNLFGGVLDAGKAVQLWTSGMGVLPEKYLKFEQVLSNLAASQATILSFQDDFFVLACVGGAGLLMTVFLRNQRDR